MSKTASMVSWRLWNIAQWLSFYKYSSRPRSPVDLKDKGIPEGSSRKFWVFFTKRRGFAESWDETHFHWWRFHGRGYAEMWFYHILQPKVVFALLANQIKYMPFPRKPSHTYLFRKFGLKYSNWFMPANYWGRSRNLWGDTITSFTSRQLPSVVPTSGDRSPTILYAPQIYQGGPIGLEGCAHYHWHAHYQRHRRPNNSSKHHRTNNGINSTNGRTKTRSKQ